MEFHLVRAMPIYLNRQADMVKLIGILSRHIKYVLEMYNI